MRTNRMRDEIDNAIGAHALWKARLRAAIATGAEELHSAEVCRDDRCALGTWLYGSSMDLETRHSVSYRSVRRLHADFHLAAGAVVRQLEQGDPAAAERLLSGEFAERSKQLVGALGWWKDELNGPQPILPPRRVA